MLKNCKKGRQNSILLRNCNGKNDEFCFVFLFLGYISYCWERMLAGYTIYSMDTKKEVAFGKIDILEESQDFVPGEEVWNKLVRRISNEILAETPLIRQL